ncbi:MAG: ROK family transcriptional regulator [Eubacteriales bacterium]|nr:ROK family transcriptional regulator [Eubacteriales bacterium]
MSIRNINNEIMKENNSKLVMDVIRHTKDISRTELAKKIGMTQASLTNIVNDLIQKGFLVETGEAESNGGRRPILLNINSTAGYVVGINLKATELCCIVTDFSANILICEYEPVEITRGVDAILEQVIGMANRCIAASGVKKDDILGVGLVSAGPYDYESGVMINPPNFMGWDNVRIKEIVSSALDLPVSFEKETPAAALAEYWFGDASRSRSLFLISIFDVGIGGSLVLDGRVYHGFKGGAAEIGHMTIDPTGKQCACGNFGCLETMADGRATTEHYRRALKLDHLEMQKLGITDVSGADLNFLIQRAQEGDDLCVRELERSANYIGIALQNVIQMYSPDTIVLAGEFVDNSDLLSERIIRTVKARHYFKHMPEIRIYKSKLGDTIFPLGGVALVLQKYFKM